MNRKLADDQRVVPLFCGVFVLACVGLFVHGLIQFDRGRRSPAWPRVEGTVVISVSSGSGYTVNCSYEVDGHTFTCYQVGFGEQEMMTNSNDAHRVQRHYPKGKAVDVYYDPAAPGISVLEPGVRPGTYYELIIPALLALMAIGFRWLHRRMTRSAHPASRIPPRKRTHSHE